MIFVGVSAALAFRVRFWNLGIEGQMIWGGIAATAVSFYDIGPPATRIPLMMLFAAIGALVPIVWGKETIGQIEVIAAETVPEFA